MTRLRWQPIAAPLLCLAGLGVSIYLTITHFAPHALVCSDNGAINCAKVTTSPQSYVFGIPVAILGLAYFVPMLALCLPVAWRAVDRRIHLVRLAFSVVGVGMIIYLITAELFIIKAICLWCSSVHLITFLLFVVVVTSAPVVLGREYGPVEPSDGELEDADFEAGYGTGGLAAGEA